MKADDISLARHYSTFAKLNPDEVIGYLVRLFLKMHCALITATGAKAGVIISKALWKRIEMLFHDVLCAIQELNIIIIIYQVRVDNIMFVNSG